jgi:alpha-ketoglutarate-dependent taurine dioxygenase
VQCVGSIASDILTGSTMGAVVDNKIPYILNTSTQTNSVEWLRENRESLEDQLNNSGAILLRNSAASTSEHFQQVVSLLCDKGLRYMYRSTPRTDLGNGLYTATEYPPGSRIPFHNENAFQREWPLLLLFFCMQPTEDGSGQTPLASTVKVTSRIAPRIQDKFRKKNVMYIRNYRKDIDLPWQTVFQTESKQAVEAYCKAQEIDCEWTVDGNLRTRQICQAFASHPRTGESIWFNQAHLFHPSGLDEATREVMAELFDEVDYPRNATYGDGTPIEEADLQEIRQAFDSESVEFRWEKGDILILDNMRISHARTPFRGKRVILTAMGRLHSPEYRPPI